MVAAFRAFEGDVSVGTESGCRSLQRRYQYVREERRTVANFCALEGDATVGAESGCRILQRRYQCL